MRFAVGALDQVARDPLDGIGVDPGADAAEQPAGLHQVGDDDPARWTFRQHRTGRQHEPRVAGALILRWIRSSCARLPVALAQPDVRQQPGQQSGVHARRRSGFSGLPDAEVAGDAAQLARQVLPLPDPQVVQELLTAHPAERTAGPLFALLAEIPPQVEVGGEVGLLVGEAGVLLASGVLTLGGAFARIGDRQRGGQHQHLPHAAFGVGLQDHPADARIEWYPSQPAAGLGEAPFTIESTEFLQQGHAVADAALLRRIEERELLDVAESEGGHLEDDCGEVGPQNFRIGVARPAREVLLGIQPDAHAGGGAPGPAGPLGRRRLRDRLDRQPLHLGAPAVAGDARGAGVDDVADARHGQRGLGDVGGQHHPSPGVGREDLLLFGGRQARVERQHLGVLIESTTKHFGGVADLALAGQEHQHVAGRFGLEFADGVNDGVGGVAHLG